MTPSLVHGDCLVELQTLPSGSVDMVLADLPFGTTQQTWDKCLDMRLLWKEYLRVTKPSAAILLFAKPPFDKVLACSNLKMYRYDWIWEKTRATGHLNANRMPLQAHECVCVFYKRQPEYHPQKTSGHTPVNNFYTRHSGACYGGAEASATGGGSTDRYPRSVLRYAPEPNTNRLHPNQKPVDLLETLILTYTSPGQTVLDNTAGSGSTLIACMKTKRRGIGIEKDQKIYKQACARITQALTNYPTSI